MGRFAETCRQVLHHGRDAAPPPPRRKDVVTEKKAESVSYEQADRGDAGTIGHPCTARECPGAKTGHKGAQSSDEPRNTTAALEVLRGGTIEAYGIEAGPDHKKDVRDDHSVIGQVGRLHLATFD